MIEQNGRDLESVPGQVVFIEGVPIAQPRPRVYAGMAVSDSPKSKAWKQAIAWGWVSGGGAFFSGPCLVTIDAYLPRPKRLMRKKDPDGAIPAPVRPDLDNLAKAILDGLQGVAYADDGAVCELRIRKLYAGKGDPPGAVIAVMPI